MKFKKMLITIITIMISFVLSVDGVYASGSSGNGSSSTGANGNGNGGTCSGEMACHNNKSFLAVKITLQYYNGKKRSVVSGTRPYYVIISSMNYNKNLATALGGSNQKCKKWEYANENNCGGKLNWFYYADHGKEYGYNSDAIFNSMLGGRHVGQKKSASHLDPWLKKLSINKNKPITTEEIWEKILAGNESCPVEFKNGKTTNNCYKKPGYRIIIEPVLRTTVTNSSRLTNIKNNYSGDVNTTVHLSKETNAGSSSKSDIIYPTVKQAAKIYGTSLGNWNWSGTGEGQGMYIQSSDIDVEYKAPNHKLSESKSVDCLKDKACGYGYNIIDVSEAAIPEGETYACVYANESQGTCSINKYNNGKLVQNKIDIKYDNGTKNGIEFPCSVIGSDFVKASDGKTYKVEGSCPGTPTIPEEPPKYYCDDLEEEYGKCLITNNLDDEFQETTDCNDINIRQGKKVWNGHILENGGCPFKPKYNYDLDISCENCDETEAQDNISFYIQDTVEAQAIFHSEYRTDNSTLKDHFLVRTDPTNLFCREEFKIKLPRQERALVESGSYFKVNEKGSENQGGIYNFKPIEVTKVRMCFSKNRDNLDSYSKDNNTFTSEDFGTIKLKYNDGNNYKDVKITLEAKGEDIINVSNATSSAPIDYGSAYGYTYGPYYYNITEARAYYRLPEDTYRYIATGRVQVGEQTFTAGISSKTKPAEKSETFMDLEIPNLPVSFIVSSKVNVSLNYNLPSNSKLKKDYTSVNSLTAGGATESNAYSKYGGKENGVRLTSCAQMFGTNTTAYNTCVSARKNGLKASEECFKKIGDENFGYSCDLTPTGIPGEDCKVSRDTCFEVAYSKGVEKDDVNKITKRTYKCPEKDINGVVKSVTCDEKTYLEKCSIKDENGISINTHSCLIQDGYYGYNGKKIEGSEEVVKKIFAAECGEELLEGKTVCEAGYYCPGSTNECPIRDDDGNGWYCNGHNKTCPSKLTCDLDAMEEKFGTKKTDKLWNGNQYISCLYAELCCPDTEMGCPSCTGTYNESNHLCMGGEWECPSSTDEISNKVIYRTIDLNNPFPGQQSKGRNTGENWCKNNITNGTFICSNMNDDDSAKGGDAGYNTVVEKNIKKNRGQERNNVYTISPMYKFNLTSSDIKKIRAYNRDHEYDDSDLLDCSGDVCTSNFFRNNVSGSGSIVEMSDGTCKNHSSLSRNGDGDIKCRMEVNG